MADIAQRIVVEIDGSGAVVGARKVKAALSEIDGAANATGREVDRGMSRVDSAARRAGAGIQSVSRPTNAARSSLAGLGAEASKTGSALSGMSSSTGILSSALSAVSANPITAVVATLGLMAKPILDAGIAMDSLNRSMVAIAGSNGGAAEMIAYLRAEADRLGQSFYNLAPSFKSIAASARGTALEGEQTQKIFSAITEASAALGLSSEQSSGALMALGQMISKGTVQAEELRGQLGERLPGAFQLAAKAMGVTTAELGKMLENGEVLATDLLPKLANELHNAYGAAAETAGLESGQAAVNRLAQEWEDLKNSLYNSRAAVDGINTVADAIDGLGNALDAVLTPFSKFYNMVDNIDEAINRVGQGRLSFADFATMNGAELAERLRETQENIDTEMANVREELLEAQRDKLSSGAGKRADEYRDVYAGLADKKLGYLKGQLSSAVAGSGHARDIAAQISSIESSMKELGVTTQSVGATDQFLQMRKGMAAADSAAQKFLTTQKKAREELEKLTQTPAQKVNAKADELKAKGVDPAMVEQYRQTELAKIAEQEANKAKRGRGSSAGKALDLDEYGTRSLSALQSASTRELDVIRARLDGEKSAVERAYESGLVNLEGYYAARRKIIDTESQAEVSAQERIISQSQAEKARLAQLKPQGSRGAEQISDQTRELDERIADAQAKIDVLKTKAETARADLSSEQAKATRARIDTAMSDAQAIISAKEQSLESRVVTGLETESTARAKLKDAIREQGQALERELVPQIEQMMSAASNPKAQAELQAVLDKIREMNAEAKTQTWADGLKQGVEDYATSASDSFQTARDAATQAFSSMEDALVEFTTTGKLSVGDMVNSMLADIARLAIRQNITQPLATGLTSVIGSLLGGTAFNVGSGAALGSSTGTGGGFNMGGGTVTGLATGGRITGPGTGTSDDVPMWGSNGEFIIREASARKLGYAQLEWINANGELPERHATGGIVGQRKSSPDTDRRPERLSQSDRTVDRSTLERIIDGNTVARIMQSDRTVDKSTPERIMPSIHAHANTIRDTPTPFSFSGLQPFAKGGVFGEAGPEAVMPLTRTSDGRLGVASTGGSANVSIEINNHTGQQVQAREVKDARGGRKVQVTIGDMVAGEMARPGSAVNKSIRNGFGLRPALVGR